MEEQNKKILDGTLDDADDWNILHLDTLLIVNGCIDRATQWPSYPEIAVNNTCDVEAVNQTTYEGMRDAVPECVKRIEDCQAVGDVYDPKHISTNETVNAVCGDAESYCTEYVRDPYTSLSGRAYYNYTILEPNLSPAPFYQGFMNQTWVQEALRVRLNWTGSSAASSRAFRSIGDYPRSGWLEYLGYLLDNGIKVNLLYGDRDFACNWIGREAASLGIPYEGTEGFQAAGYEPMHANNSYISGQVRHNENLSFVRLYEAGHKAPTYQPETAYRNFIRLNSTRTWPPAKLTHWPTQTITRRAWTKHGSSAHLAQSSQPIFATCWILEHVQTSSLRLLRTARQKSESTSWLTLIRRRYGLAWRTQVIRTRMIRTQKQRRGDP